MKNVERRLATLETQQRDEKKGLGPEAKEAMGRIYKSLRMALPVEPVTSRHSKTFENLVCELHERMKAGAMTAADRVVLNSLLAADLVKAGLSAEGVVELYAYIFNSI